MITRISHTEEFERELKEQGKFRLLDSPKDIEAMQKMNEEIAKVRRHFRFKNAMSEISASKTFFTT